MKSGTDLINEAKGNIRQVNATEAQAIHARGRRRMASTSRKGSSRMAP